MSFLFALFVICDSYWISPSSPSLPSAVWRMAIGSHEQSIFLLGGMVEFHNHNHLLVYNVEGNNFTNFSIPEFSSLNSSGHFYTSLDSTIYMLNRQMLNVYNMETKIYIAGWKQIQQKVTNDACLASITNYLFVIGGYVSTDSGGDEVIDTVHVLQLSTMEWMANVSSMNKPRMSHSCIADPINKKLYAIGGETAYTQYSSIELIYISTIATDWWTTYGEWIYNHLFPYGNNLTMPLSSSRAVIYENTIFVIGGYNHDNGLIAKVHLIDTASNAVSVSSDDLVYGVDETAAIVVDGMIYSFGGLNWDLGGPLKTWQYYQLLTTSTTTSSSSYLPTKSPITSKPTAPTRSLDYCSDIIVEIINLDGITTYNFRINDALQDAIANMTANGIAASSEDHGINRDLLFVEYKSVSDQINITESVCVESKNVLNVMNAVIVEKADIIAEYIKNQMINYFAADDEVSTDNLTVIVSWKSYSSQADHEEHPDQQTIQIMEIPSLYITITILGLFGLFAMISLFDAKYCRQNDYFSAKSIIMPSLEVSDAILDLLFAIVLLLKYIYATHKDIEILIACIAAFIFIIIPISYSIFQLVRKAKKSWFKDSDLSNWLKDNGKVLFFFSIITGSSYTAIEIVNCGAFKCEIFSMGLNKQQQLKFNAKRVIGVVCLENIPQIVIQIWYLGKFGVDFLPVLSIIFSIISIILTVLTVYTQRAIIKNQEIIKIGFDVIGDDIEPTLATKTNEIKSKICVLLGVKTNLLEIQQPKVVSQGLRFEICLFTNKAHYATLNVESIITTAVDNGKLSNIIKDEWNLENIPTVKFVATDGHTVEIECVTTNKYASVKAEDDDAY